jgi:hypothetical protein
MHSFAQKATTRALRALAGCSAEGSTLVRVDEWGFPAVCPDCGGDWSGSFGRSPTRGEVSRICSHGHHMRRSVSAEQIARFELDHVPEELLAKPIWMDGPDGLVDTGFWLPRDHCIVGATGVLNDIPVHVAAVQPDRVVVVPSSD